MNLVVRRRLAAGALLSSSALVAGLLLAPSSDAAAGGLSVTPSGVVTNTTQDLTFKGTDADFEYGGTATFTRVGGGQPFDVTLDDPTVTGNPPKGKNTTGTAAAVSFSDMGDGVGNDGPADAGTYNVSATGAAAPVPNPLAPGGGTDTCASCFTVLPNGTITITSVTPSSIRPGSQANIAIAGASFERGTRIQFFIPGGLEDTLITANKGPNDTSSPPKETVKGITTAKQLLRRATVDINDQPGARDVRVTNLDGSTATCTACFFVAGPALTSISPTSGLNTPGLSPVTVTMSGSNVVSGGTPRLEFVGSPGSATKDALSLDPISQTQSDGQTVSGTFDLQNAAPGPYQAVVRNNTSGITNACEQPQCAQFTVVQSNRTPTVSGLDRDPNTAGNQKDQQAGTTQVFNVAGTNFSMGVAIKVLNAGATTAATGVTVTAVEFVGPTLVKATIVTAKTATSGDYDVTATLTDGTASAACSKCYTVAAAQPTASPSPSSASPSSSGCPTPGSSASGSPTPSSSASTSSASPSATASVSPSASASTTASPTASTSATALPVPLFAAATPSATSTATVSPSGSPKASGCPSPTRQTATLTAERSVINAGESVNLSATGAPNERYSLQCYTRPSTSYTEARAGSFSAAGDPITFTLSLGRNTRCFLRYVSNPTQGASDSVVVNVKTVLSLSAIRKAVRTYEFRGRNLPRVAGQLITLYRVDNAGNEIRTSNLKTDSSGIFTVTRKFTGSGTFRFVVRTSQTNDNAPGHSNTITVSVH